MFEILDGGSGCWYVFDTEKTSDDGTIGEFTCRADAELFKAAKENVYARMFFVKLNDDGSIYLPERVSELIADWQELTGSRLAIQLERGSMPKPDVAIEAQPDEWKQG